MQDGASFHSGRGAVCLLKHTIFSNNFFMFVEFDIEKQRRICYNKEVYDFIGHCPLT